MASAGELGVDSVLDVVKITFGLEGEVSGSEYRVLCPNPGHDDSHPSCGINLVTGYFHCFSCGTGGDLVELGHMVTGQSRPTIKADLQPSTMDALQRTLAVRLKRINTATVATTARSRLIELPGPYEPGPLRYLRDRGFTSETLKRWGIRWCPEQVLPSKKGGSFTIQNTIAIPIRDEHHRLLSWCYRATPLSPSWQPKYLYSPEADISTFWWGMEHHAHASTVVVTEGALDAMNLDQMGYPAVALLGSHMPEAKIKMLQRYRGVIIMGDRDRSGVEMVRRIGAVLGDRIPVRVVRYASWMPGKDVNEMNPIDVDIAVTRALPWTKFQLLGSG